MQDETIMFTSSVGQLLDKIGDGKKSTYLVFNGKKIQLTAKIRIGRASDNDVVIDNKLASRYHAVLQKIKNDFYIKDENSTNGTLINGEVIPKDKYVKLNHNDKITIGNATLIIT